MMTEFMIAVVIFILFLVWFRIDVKKRRWGTERIGSLASSVLFLDYSINPNVPQQYGPDKPMYKNIVADAVNMNTNKTLADIDFTFVNQDNSRESKSFTFALKDSDISTCPVVLDDSLCINV